MQDEIKLVERAPTLSNYQYLRNLVGWSTVSDKSVQQSLENHIYSVCLVVGEKTIGFGRIVGDAAIYYYIQDVIVHPDYRGQGLGKQIMCNLLLFIKKNADENSFIGLMAAKGHSEFYEQFGFNKRAKDSPGMYMYTKDLTIR